MDYKNEKENLNRYVEETEFLLEINKILTKYNGQFINPYIQNIKLEHILNQERDGTLTQEKIDSFFISELYDLNSTLSFVDGIFKRSDFISPYNYFIESSLILCFQKDYSGAINLILPAIEASISRYVLRYRKTSISEGNRYQKIKASILLLKEDLLLNIKNDFETKNFNKQQQKQLMKLHRMYFDNWTNIINEFFNESLFAHTSINKAENTLNRHSILHLLDLKKYNSIINYIKLFNSLKFLAWLFLQVEGKSILTESENGVYVKKRLLYEELIKKSNKVVPIKNSILQNYNLNTELEYSLKNSFEPINNGMSISSKLYLSLKKWVWIEKSKNQLK